ncbi:MAG: Uma2 family endonuclease [Thermodesulfovibrionales bacterium]
MGLAQKRDRRYSYKDYLTWPDEERWEIIDGTAYNMSPAPTLKHQDIAGTMYSRLREAAIAKGCKAYIAPTDVVFDDFNVVQPDVLVVCDKTKITEKNIQGAPDLIVEVLSPATESKDRREKWRLYERFGVKDYIMVSPEGEFLEHYTLKDGRYSDFQLFTWDETMTIESLCITLNLWDIFGKAKEGEGEA